MSIRLLIVDDSPETLDVLEMMYRQHSEIRTLVTARGITEALSACNSVPIDMVSIDARLQHESGFELCDMIRQNYPSIFVTMCSLEFDVQRMSDGAHSGPHYFLEKPVRFEDIASALIAYRNFRSQSPRQEGSPVDDTWFDTLILNSPD